MNKQEKRVPTREELTDLVRFYFDHPELLPPKPEEAKPRRLARVQESIRGNLFWNRVDFGGCLILAVIAGIVVAIIEGC